MKEKYFEYFSAVGEWTLPLKWTKQLSIESWLNYTNKIKYNFRRVRSYLSPIELTYLQTDTFDDVAT